MDLANVSDIPSRIYEVRGIKVMLDFDLSQLYQIETRVLNQAINRNLESFPDDFMFRLTEDEWKTMSSQIVMTSLAKRPKRAIPYAFTEHGVTMLASVLKSPVARKMNIAVVRAFVAIKRILVQEACLLEQLNRLKVRLDEHDIQLSGIYDAIEKMLDEKAEQKTWDNRERIGFRHGNG
jgi:hypothetical protein